MKITKLDAAKKQLDYATNGYFHGIDLVILFPIAGAAHVLTHDLMESSKKGDSWVCLTNSQSPAEIKAKLKELRASYNWLKHANNDLTSEISISAIELENLLMTSILDLAELTKSSGYFSETTYSFYLWFIAKNITELSVLCEPGLIEEAKSCFPDMHRLSPENQIKQGLIYLNKRLKEI